MNYNIGIRFISKYIIYSHYHIFLHFRFITGALIEYAVILFKKQKLGKFGNHSQSAYASYPHGGQAMSSYMSMRRPNKDSNTSGINPNSQMRQRSQPQTLACPEQYSMDPIVTCRYDWNQGE